MSEKVVLKGDDAIALWKAGKDAWNQWVKDNPKADVSFLGVNFNAHRKASDPISFSEYLFPHGDVNFAMAQFGDGNVDFSDAQFDKGTVSFHFAMFGEGDVNFTRTIFGNEQVNFNDTKFGNGNVNFSHAEFRQNKEGYVNFHEASFGTGNINFNGALFHDGYVIFEMARFGKGSVNFDLAQFGNGNVNFNMASFGDGEATFIRTTFGNGSVTFNLAQFGNCRVRFSFAKLDGNFIFAPELIDRCSKLDLSAISVGGVLSLGEFSTSCVIDLRHSKISCPIDLDRVDINYRLESVNWKRWPFRRADNVSDSTCFRRLKKLAKDADDHQRSLDFYAKEMRSSYGHSLTGWKLAWFFAYDKISDYGRSLLFPFLYLALFTELFGIIYWWKGTEATRSIFDGLIFSLGHAVPLYAGSREARGANAQALFGSIDKIPDYIHVLTVTQGLICGSFLFLIALALRNLFRS